jgi:acetyl-CoA C-acetyltransferase
VLAAGDRAYELCERPAFITGIDHRIETHASAPGTSPLALDQAGRREGRGGGEKKVDVAELHAPFAHQELILVEALGLGDDVDLSTLGRRAGGQPDDVGRAHPHRRGGPAHLVGPGRPGRGPRHLGPVPATEPGLRPGGCVMSERCAVIGIGQTVAKSKREDVSIAGLVREAAVMALEDAGLTFADIDAVVIGKAPDMFEGVMMPELYLAPALGAVGKPMFRVHTAGSVGGSTAIVAAHLVASGIHDRVLTVAFEKQSDSDAMWALSVPQPFSTPAAGRRRRLLRPHHPGLHAPLGRAARHRHEGGGQGPAARAEEPLRPPPPARHLLKMVEDSIMLWDPLHYLESCPSSDGAAAMVIGLGAAPWPRPSRTPGPAGLDPRHGHALGAHHVRRPGPGQPPGRAGLRGRPLPPGRHHRPRADFDMAEVYVPFSWYEPMWLENLGFCAEGDGWKLTEAGATSMIDGGDIPWNCSGGVLSSNPIGASGMLRFLETALQVRGLAGEHQVPDARRPSARPTVAARSSSPCGWSGSTSPEGGGWRPGRYARRCPVSQRPGGRP